MISVPEEIVKQYQDQLKLADVKKVRYTWHWTAYWNNHSELKLFNSRMWIL